MSRVTGIGAGGVIPGKPRPAATQTGSNFNIEGDAAAAPTRELPAASGVMLSSMLALQEVETETVRDKTARRHGLALLQALAQLQKGLLSGLGDNEAEIAELVKLATAMPEAADPGLLAILDAVRLRAKIELLRRGVEIT